MDMKNYLDQWDYFFIQYKASLLAFAFRMTGSLSDAEDIVQETFLECANIDPQKINNPKAWLTKICSNKGLDHLKSAYKKRELYPGTWLPDEIPESLQVWGSFVDEGSPEEAFLRAETLTTSFLLLIERLTPEERVIYLLNEVFAYSFKEIAEFLKKKEESCRKTAQRAREALLAGKIKFSTPPTDADKVIAQFFTLAKSGDIQGLTEMLAPDSQLWGDGGGKVRAAGFIDELPAIIEFLRSLVTSDVFRLPSYQIEYHQVNSRPGIVISKKIDSGLWIFDTILSFEFFDKKIARIYAQRNPDKLASLLAIA